MDLTLLAFATVVVIAIATPGPTVLLALSNGSRYGVLIAFFGMGGAILSDLVLIGAVSLGLGALLATSQFWFSVLKWLGVAYLVFLGVSILRRRGRAGPKAARMEVYTRVDPTSVFLRSFLVAVTNPKGYLFFTAFLPQFVDPSAAILPQYALLTAIFIAIDFAVMAAYAALGATTARALRADGLRWIERLCGSTFLALAAGLALYRRNGG
ncbi:Threonine/homoserine/homoserine lactone efflux protein [Aliiroseovarius sediminilitoris]|uniref:Threonine/homoserine/homoserine lactone efflux protein n=1 Tax=Aliiroseovarius sediminilitoris TaxID=1173584 RepID=A0A1I0PDA4_9RHOB|nr:LysE family translocator [Aliiroseovarius sediminilitoris]SEW12205.1 Threonine/homoserine/homoserine lactone efflux protein [Aliiroseovarius sediminilitoris]